MPMIENYFFATFGALLSHAFEKTNLLQTIEIKLKDKQKRKLFKQACHKADDAIITEYGKETVMLIDYPDSVDINWMVHCFDKLRNSGHPQKAFGSPELFLEFKERNGVSPDEIVTFFVERFFEELAQDPDLRSLLTWINSEESRKGTIKILAELADLHAKFDQPIKNTFLPKRLTAKIPIIAPDSIIGRHNDLEDLHDRLFANKQVVLVNGLGGIGKTTLAQAYMGKYLEEYQHVAWFSLISNDIPSDVLNTEAILENLRNYNPK